MSSAERPYFRSNHNELRQAAETHWNDVQKLEMVRHELSFRGSTASQQLSNLVRDRVLHLQATNGGASTPTQTPYCAQGNGDSRTMKIQADCLTPEQRKIVELPWSTKALVIAGPGTG